MTIESTLLACCCWVTLPLCVHAETQVRIDFAILKTFSDLGVYAAKALGYLKKVDIEAKVPTCSGGNEVIPVAF